MCGSTRAVTWKTLDRFVSMTESHSSSDILASERSRVIPALLTRTSTRAAAFDDAGDRRVDGRGIADVATDGVRLAPGSRDLGGDLVPLCLEVVSLIVGEIANRHGTAKSSEFESDLPADAA